MVTYRAAQLNSELLLLIFVIFFLSIKKEENLPAEPLFAVGTNLANEASDGFLTLEHVTKAITCTDQWQASAIKTCNKNTTAKNIKPASTECP